MTRLTSHFSKFTAQIFFVVVSVFVLSIHVQQAQALTCDISPAKIDVDLLYHGTKLVITGKSDPGDDLIIQIASPPEDSHLKYKGKAAGLFWMKMGTMTFKDMPSVYMLFSSKNLNQLLENEELVRYRLGYKALEEQAEIETQLLKADKDRWFKEFIKFKEKDTLYKIREGSVTRKHSPEGNTYQVDLKWPFQAPPGDYTVKAIAVRDGHVVEKSETTVTVARTGMVAKLSDMAFNNAAVYGLTAIIIALVCGIAVGLVFKSSGGH